MLAAVCGMALLGSATPAYAGGSWLDAERESYEPGDTARFAGDVGPGQLGWVEDGPFRAYLRTQPAAAVCCPGNEEFPEPGTVPGDVPLGRLNVEETGRSGAQSLRISIAFTVPVLAPGTYEIVYCSADCTTGIGDLVGATLRVGNGPPTTAAPTTAPTTAAPAAAGVDAAAAAADAPGAGRDSHVALAVGVGFALLAAVGALIALVARALRG